MALDRHHALHRDIPHLRQIELAIDVLRPVTRGRIIITTFCFVSEGFTTSRVMHVMWHASESTVKHRRSLCSNPPFIRQSHRRPCRWTRRQNYQNHHRTLPVLSTVLLGHQQEKRGQCYIVAFTILHLVNKTLLPPARLANDQTEINRIIAEASKGSKFYDVRHTPYSDHVHGIHHVNMPVCRLEREEEG
jgi:hypothetical protein